LCISFSKLLAMQSFLRFFPRALAAHFSISPVKALAGLFFELFFAPLAIFLPNMPVDHVLRRMTGADYGMWEMDAGLSPVVLFIFVAGLLLVRENPFRRLAGFLFASRRRILALAAIAVFGVVSVEFTLARGFPFSVIKTLPFFSSLHANTRNAAIFILPVIVTAVFLRRRLEASGRGARILNPWMLSLCSILLFAGYVRVPHRFGHLNFTQIEVDAKSLAKCWSIIRTSPDSMVCRHIMDIHDDQVFFNQASSSKPLMPILGYQLEYYKPAIRQGPVTDTLLEAFNMTNPASLVYPEENDLGQFERISVNDKENFLNFIHNRPTTWKRPPNQYVADYVSLDAFILAVVILLGYGVVFTARKSRLLTPVQFNKKNKKSC
jgi:hypothetical protein